MIKDCNVVACDSVYNKQFDPSVPISHFAPAKEIILFITQCSTNVPVLLKKEKAEGEGEEREREREKKTVLVYRAAPERYNQTWRL